MVAETKVANDRGPMIKLNVAINGHMADVKVSGGPSADQSFRGYTWGSDLCQGVKVSGFEVETCCVHIDLVLMTIPIEIVERCREWQHHA